MLNGGIIRRQGVQDIQALLRVCTVAGHGRRIITLKAGFHRKIQNRLMGISYRQPAVVLPNDTVAVHFQTAENPHPLLLRQGRILHIVIRGALPLHKQTIGRAGDIVPQRAGHRRFKAERVAPACGESESQYVMYRAS